MEFNLSQYGPGTVALLQAGERQSRPEPVVPPEAVQDATKQAKPVPNATEALTPVSVLIQNGSAGELNYQVMDDRTGQVLRAIPPDHVRSIQKGIADRLRRNGQKGIDLKL
jgi:hypothetical protein